MKGNHKILNFTFVTQTSKEPIYVHTEEGGPQEKESSVKESYVLRLPDGFDCLL